MEATTPATAQTPWVVPQIISFTGLASSVSHTYRNADEAVKHSLDNARFMRQDIGIMECLESRMRSVALLDWHLEVDGPDLPRHKALVERMTSILRSTPRFTQYRYNLLEALWYGRYAVQNIYTRDGNDIAIGDWSPINGDKLVFKYSEEGDPRATQALGVLIGAHWAAGDRIDGRLVEPTQRGLAVFLDVQDRQKVVVHRHLIEDAAYETPFDSGAINGIGIRSRIYWEWFQKQELLALFMEYLERAALGFEIWYYPEGNDKARRDLQAAAENRNGRKTVLMFPKPMGDDQMAYGVEHIDPNPAGAEAFKEVLQGYFGHRVKRYILGQVLTSEAEATGLGSGVADPHLQTLLDIIKFDATNLEETISREVLRPLVMFNDPSALGAKLRFVIQTESPDVEAKLSGFRQAWEMGARLKESDVMAAIGAAIPEPGEPVLQAGHAAQSDQPSGENKSPRELPPRARSDQDDEPQDDTGS